MSKQEGFKMGEVRAVSKRGSFYSSIGMCQGLFFH